MKPPDAGPTTSAPTRRLDLDAAKGLGIFLVVLGHIAARSQPANNAWYSYTQTALYQFHMPFFMYLSGYVCYYSGAARITPPAWPRLLRRRAERLLVPFALFGLALIAGKLIATHFMHVDNAPASVGQALAGLLWHTDNSPAISVWYIAVVFVLTIVTPPVMWATAGKAWPLIALAGLVYLLPVPHILYMDRVARFFIFFSMGGIAADGGERWLAFVDRYTWVCCGLFVAIVGAAVFFFDSFNDPERLFVCGAMSMPALHGLVRKTQLASSDVLVGLGSLSFVIYLLNTPFIGFVKGVLLLFMPWDGVNFLVFFPLMLAGGMLGPIIVKRYVFRHFRALDRMTD